MSGKPNTKWMETMIAKHGSREAVSAVQAAIGAKGGRLSKNGGFAADRNLARIAGAKGGRISKRGKKEVKDGEI